MLLAADVKLLFDERRLIDHSKKTPRAMSTGVGESGVKSNTGQLKQWAYLKKL